MHRVNGAGSSQFHSYWSGRALENQIRLSQTESHQLRVVYLQLIDHYQRMAKLFDAGAARSTTA